MIDIKLLWRKLKYNRKLTELENLAYDEKAIQEADVSDLYYDLQASASALSICGIFLGTSLSFHIIPNILLSAIGLPEFLLAFILRVAIITLTRWIITGLFAGSRHLFGLRAPKYSHKLLWIWTIAIQLLVFFVMFLFSHTK